MEDHPDLGQLLVRHWADLEALVQRNAGALLRHDTREDLAQGARVRALESAPNFVWQGPAAFHGWLARVVRSHLDDRRAYWAAARRSAGHVLRVTETPASADGAGVVLASPGTGPLTFAERRDQLVLATQAVGTLLPRDQEILALERRGASPSELAAALGVSEEAAARARLRALERFRRAYELFARGG
jgi:RNA polymerase sigma factor (sigma-70 family)